MKITVFEQRKLLIIEEFKKYFYNLFNTWLKRRQLDSPIHFCIQFVEILFWLKFRKKNLDLHRYVGEREDVF